MCAADFRASARNALRGNWVLAIIAGLIARILAGTSQLGPSLKLNVDSSSGVSASIDGIPFSSELTALLAGAAVLVLLAAIAMALVYFTIGSVVNLGYARFNLTLIDGGRLDLADLFSCFSQFKTAFCARFLTSLYIALWSLLLVIPGIVASYSYAMTSYILVEHPELTASQAIQRSKELMAGNRWRLFCLDFSFIGWNLLCTITLGLASLWVNPYIEAAHAAFYREITTGAVPSAPSSDPFFQNPA